jgi:CRP-like cAMP-binding protein
VPFRQDIRIGALRRSALFEGLSRTQLARVARISDVRELPAGAVVCREGEPGEEFFVIVDGAAAVSRGGRPVATVGTGDFFGEIALLERVRRTATVMAATPLRFLVIRAEAFDFVVSADPTMERRLQAALARRSPAATRLA